MISTLTTSCQFSHFYFKSQFLRSNIFTSENIMLKEHELSKWANHNEPRANWRLATACKIDQITIITIWEKAQCLRLSVSQKHSCSEGGNYSTDRKGNVVVSSYLYELVRRNLWQLTRIVWTCSCVEITVFSAL